MDSTDTPKTTMTITLCTLDAQELQELHAPLHQLQPQRLHLLQFQLRFQELLAQVAHLESHTTILTLIQMTIMLQSQE